MYKISRNENFSIGVLAWTPLTLGETQDHNHLVLYHNCPLERYIRVHSLFFITHYVGVPGFGHSRGSRFVLQYSLRPHSIDPHSCLQIFYQKIWLCRHSVRIPYPVYNKNSRMLCIRELMLYVGVPGFEPGVTCTQNRHVSRYTTPRDARTDSTRKHYW